MTPQTHAAGAVPMTALRPQQHAPKLVTYTHLRGALLVLVERVQLQRNAFYARNGRPALTQSQVDQLRTLALAMLCLLLEDTSPGQGEQLEHLVWGDDLADEPAAGAAAADSHEAPTVPAPLYPLSAL